MIIGSHVSFKKDTQLLGSIKEALSYGANTFMFYTGAPQNTMRSNINEEITLKAKEMLKEENIDIDNLIVHAPYIINLANLKNEEFSINFLTEEIKRVEQLGVKKLVLHPGSHVGVGVEEGLNNIINALNKVLTKDMNILICLESMAGKGSELGTNFNELKTIIEGVTLKEKIAVCLDTCHLNDAGFDLTKFDEILKQFDEIIGLNRLACIHINDSKNTIGMKKDRHENFGFGEIGFDTLSYIINHKQLKDVPKILETPYVGEKKEYPPYKQEIEMIKENKFNPNLIEDIKQYYK